MAHHRDTTGTPLDHRDTTGRDTTGTPPGHQEESRLGHRPPQNRRFSENGRKHEHRDTTGTLPGHHWTYCNTTGTLPGHDQDITGTPPAHRTRPDQHCDTETPPKHHRNTTGTSLGHHRDTTGTGPLHCRDTTGTPPRHHWDTTATPLGHNAARPGHHYTTETPPGHQEEKRLGHRTVHSPKMDASTNMNRVRSRPQTRWLLGNNKFARFATPQCATDSCATL